MTQALPSACSAMSGIFELEMESPTAIVSSVDATAGIIDESSTSRDLFDDVSAAAAAAAAAGGGGGGRESTIAAENMVQGQRQLGSGYYDPGMMSMPMGTVAAAAAAAGEVAEVAAPPPPGSSSSLLPISSHGGSSMPTRGVLAGTSTAGAAAVAAASSANPCQPLQGPWGRLQEVRRTYHFLLYMHVAETIIIA